MALDTTIGGADSDSYNTLTELNDYAQDYGSPDSFHVATDSTKEQGLRIATQWIDSNYGTRFLGEKTDCDQSLEWPRRNVSGDCYIATDVIPAQVKTVCNLLAIEYIDGVDIYDESSSSGAGSSGTVKATSKKVGSLESSIEYAVADSTQAKTTSSRLNSKYYNMLKPYLASTSSTQRG